MMSRAVRSWLSSSTCEPLGGRPALSLTWLSYLERERHRDLADVPVIYCCAAECRTPVQCGAGGRCLQVLLTKTHASALGFSGLAPVSERWDEDDTFAVIYHLMGA